MYSWRIQSASFFFRLQESKGRFLQCDYRKGTKESKFKLVKWGENSLATLHQTVRNGRKKENGGTGARLNCFCWNSCLDADLEHKQKHRSALPCGYVAQHRAWQARGKTATASLPHQNSHQCSAGGGRSRIFSTGTMCIMCAQHTDVCIHCSKITREKSRHNARILLNKKTQQLVCFFFIINTLLSFGWKHLHLAF